MSDLDAAIVEARVSGESERDVCLRLGCTMGRVRAALDARAERTLSPENVLRLLIESFDRLGALERTFAPRAKAGDVEAARVVAEARRQRARTAKLVLQRAPASRPV